MYVDITVNGLPPMEKQCITVFQKCLHFLNCGSISINSTHKTTKQATQDAKHPTSIAKANP